MGKIQLVMTKIGCRYRQDKRYQEGYYDCSSHVAIYVEMVKEVIESEVDTDDVE